VQDSVCEAWRNYCSAITRGKHTLTNGAARGRGKHGQVTPGTIALFANRAYDVGRRFTGTSSEDILADKTRLSGRVKVITLDDTPPTNGLDDCTLREVLADRRAENAPAELSAQNIDWGNFYRNGLLDDRQRVVLDLLASGYRTGELAEAIGVSAPRVVQLTDALGDAATQFFGAEVVPVARTKGKSARRRGRPSTKIYIPLSARPDTRQIAPSHPMPAIAHFSRLTQEAREKAAQDCLCRA
jgi:hypothetical protein